MSQYALILIWIAFVAIIGRSSSRTEYIDGKKEKRVYWLFAIIVFVPVILMAADRGGFADTRVYIMDYGTMPPSFSSIGNYMQTVKKDSGFYLVSAVLRVILGPDPYYYLLVFAIFQGFSIIKLYRRYSVNYVMSVFLFIASSDYISWMFNGLRQFMAVTIILLATPLMIKKTQNFVFKKYIPLFLIIWLASTMHRSALLMIPLVAIAQGEAWNRKTLIFIGAVILAITFVSSFTDLLDDALTGTQYANVISDYEAWEDDGTNPIRVLVYSVPAIMSFFCRKEIQKNGGRLINLCTNMCIMSSGLYIISMFTSGVFMGRLPIYCSMYGYILLPWIFENVFSKKHRNMIYFVTIACYLGFYYYQMHTTWGIM